jgi:mono/diheme cytochrome c family protein
MRASMILLALASLSACNRNASESEQPVVSPMPAEITYDGGSYKTDAEKMAHGERMSFMLGCNGCHGDDLRGQNVTKGDPDFGDMWAPNLTLVLANYDDVQLKKFLRSGVPKDGRPFWFMPTETLQFVSDADLDAVIAHIRTMEPGGKVMPPIKKGPEFEGLVEKGDLEAAVPTAARFRRELLPDLGSQHALGRYIAQTTCAECHNSQLQGYEDFSPNLDIVGVYDVPELERLLTTGEGKVKKDLGLMTETAQHRFAKLTLRERAAVIAYVKARANRPQAAQ